MNEAIRRELLRTAGFLVNAAAGNGFQPSLRHTLAGSGPHPRGLSDLRIIDEAMFPVVQSDPSENIDTSITDYSVADRTARLQPGTMFYFRHNDPRSADAAIIWDLAYSLSFTIAEIQGSNLAMQTALAAFGFPNLLPLPKTALGFAAPAVVPLIRVWPPASPYVGSSLRATPSRQVGLPQPQTPQPPSWNGAAFPAVPVSVPTVPGATTPFNTTRLGRIVSNEFYASNGAQIDPTGAMLAPLWLSSTGAAPAQYTVGAITGNVTPIGYVYIVDPAGYPTNGDMICSLGSVEIVQAQDTSAPPNYWYGTKEEAPAGWTCTHLCWVMHA